MFNDGYTSLTGYVRHLIEEKTAKLEAERDGLEFTDEDKEKIKERLKELGYL